jgi:hypothetical protein
MRPWIAVAYSAPVAAATAVFLIYPIGQGSFSDGYLGLVALLVCQAWLGGSQLLHITGWSNPKVKLYLKGEHPTFLALKNFFKQSLKTRLVLTRATPLPDPGGGPEKDNNNKKEGNPLLNNNSTLINGKRIAFSDYDISIVENLSTVYCIFCKNTGKYLVGETINFKKRSNQHLTSLNLGGHSNSSLQADYKLYGLEAFEFVIVQEGGALADHTTRLQVQNSLIETLNANNASYTSGLAETTQPRFAGMYPSKAGVFLIVSRVEKNRPKYYVGHSAQKLGMGGRIRSIIAALRNGSFANTSLQADWNAYGEKYFDFVPVNWGDDFTAIANRLNLANYFINHILVVHGQAFLYNQNYAASGNERRPIPATIVNANQFLDPPVIKPYEVGNSEMIFPPPLDLFPGANTIYLADRQPIVAEGQVFLSVREAAKFLGVNWNVVSDKVNGANPDYFKATTEQVYDELIRRRWSTDISDAPPVIAQTPKARTTKGIPKAIVVENTYFPTIAAAATFYGVSPNSVRKWPRSGYRQAYFPEDHPNGPPNPGWAPR